MYANDSDKNVRYEIYQLCSIVPTLEREKGCNEDQYNWILGEADMQLGQWAENAIWIRQMLHDKSRSSEKRQRENIWSRRVAQSGLTGRGLFSRGCFSDASLSEGRFFGRWLMKGAWSRGSAQGRSKPFSVTTWDPWDDERAGPSHVPRHGAAGCQAVWHQDLEIIGCKSLNNLALKSMVKYAFASISSGFHHMISASRCLRRRGEDQTHRLLSIFAFLPSPRLELERKPWFDTQTANASTTILLQTQYQTFIACDCSAVSHWDITGHISY